MKKSETHVYLVDNKRGHFKIGISNDPTKRHSSFLTVSPDVEMIFSCPGSIYFEKFLHRKFAAKRVKREWFALDAADKEWIVSGRAKAEYDATTTSRIVDRLCPATGRKRPRQRRGTPTVRECMVRGTHYFYVNMFLKGRRYRRHFHDEQQALVYARSIIPTLQEGDAIAEIHRRKLTIGEVLRFYDEQNHHSPS